MVFSSPLAEAAHRLVASAEDVKDDHFHLRASLPGYSMHRSSNGDEPLNVKVIGRTLVVQGSKRSSALFGWRCCGVIELEM